VRVDHYAGAGHRWATGASLVYGPIARALVARSPHPLQGRRVLDAGAGTGVASEALAATGAGPIATDLSADMLRYQSQTRPPSAVADICALPLADDVVDDSVAAFVLNHLTEPERGIAELARVTRSSGAVLACVFANSSRSEARDAVDEVALAAGWQVPDWYLGLKVAATPLLGEAPRMHAAAEAAGLTEVSVAEEAVEVGVTEPGELVDYRLGQAHFASWFASLSPTQGDDVRSRAIEAVRPIMQPYRPIVVFLTARVSGR
jgi:SAM-dependent methyltransferase